MWVAVGPDFHFSARDQRGTIRTHRKIRREPTGRLIPVIVLADLPHGHQGLQVLVGLVRVDVVQGAAVPGVPI